MLPLDTVGLRAGGVWKSACDPSGRAVFDVVEPGCVSAHSSRVLGGKPASRSDFADEEKVAFCGKFVETGYDVVDWDP